MTGSPIVIAHRGASGYLPEHTLASKALAIGLGADFVEQDVVASRDGKLVVLHDLYLDDVTDVAQRYPGRQRSDGRHYVVDFDLDELATLTVFERRAPGSVQVKYPARFPADSCVLGIATLEQELRLVQGLSKSMGRTIGVYPEIKHPRWHAEHGIDIAKLLVAELNRFGYSRRDDAAFVQCFDSEALIRVRQQLGCELRLIQLVGSDREYAKLLTVDGLRQISEYAYGLGPHYPQLAEPSRDGLRLTPLTHWTHDSGLRLHPYTFRRDELPPYARTLDELLEFFFVEARVDGVFCDHPDVAVRVRDRLRKVQ
jgi:glycerophosphoryl diester phosphodiesterase